MAERVFWVQCPKCNGDFYANYRELRDTGVKLECPFCTAKFLPLEARSLDERTDAPQ
jgi:hypothetical protein